MEGKHGKLFLEGFRGLLGKSDGEYIILLYVDNRVHSRRSGAWYLYTAQAQCVFLLRI